MGKVKKPRETSILKGALAGLVGGIVGAGAKALAARLYSPQNSRLLVSPSTTDAAIQDAVKPWVVGAAAGAVYGAAMEIEPAAGVWGGAGFGLGLRKFSKSTFDADAAETSVRQSIRQRQSEWLTYAVFGVVTEGVRRVVRKGL